MTGRSFTIELTDDQAAILVAELAAAAAAAAGIIGTAWACPGTAWTGACCSAPSIRFISPGDAGCGRLMPDE